MRPTLRAVLEWFRSDPRAPTIIYVESAKMPQEPAGSFGIKSTQRLVDLLLANLETRGLEIDDGVRFSAVGATRGNALRGACVGRLRLRGRYRVGHRLPRERDRGDHGCARRLGVMRGRTGAEASARGTKETDGAVDGRLKFASRASVAILGALVLGGVGYVTVERSSIALRAEGETEICLQDASSVDGALACAFNRYRGVLSLALWLPNERRSARRALRRPRVGARARNCNGGAAERGRSRSGAGPSGRDLSKQRHRDRMRRGVRAPLRRSAGGGVRRAHATRGLASRGSGVVGRHAARGGRDPGSGAEVARRGWALRPG